MTAQPGGTDDGYERWTRGGDVQLNALAASRLDWATLWDRDTTASEWVCEPFIARGRAHALVGGAKSGKSELALAVTAALATGQRVLYQPAGDALTVVYADYEMTEDDVLDRLTDLGYGPDSDLGRLHYCLLPTIPPLDSAAGGAEFLAYCTDVGADVAVIDTTARAVSGEENDADTFRDFARCTGQRLKAAGITWVRVDHTGKDESRGARGSSAKVDDVDVVWQVRRTEGGLQLRATHRRMAWVPPTVDLQRVEEPELRYQVVSGSWPAGTQDAARALTSAGVPHTASTRNAQSQLREAGCRLRREKVTAGLRFLRAQAEGWA